MLHTHTHTHTHTHACTQARMNLHTCTHTYRHARAHAHTSSGSHHSYLVLLLHEWLPLDPSYLAPFSIFSVPPTTSTATPNVSQPQFNVTITFDPNVCDTRTFSKMVINITGHSYSEIFNYLSFRNRTLNGQYLYGNKVNFVPKAYGFVYSTNGTWPVGANGFWEITVRGRGSANTTFTVVEGMLNTFQLLGIVGMSARWKLRKPWDHQMRYQAFHPEVACFVLLSSTVQTSCTTCVLVYSTRAHCYYHQWRALCLSCCRVWDHLSLANHAMWPSIAKTSPPHRHTSFWVGFQAGGVQRRPWLATPPAATQPCGI